MKYHDARDNPSPTRGRKIYLHLGESEPWVGSLPESGDWGFGTWHAIITAGTFADLARAVTCGERRRVWGGPGFALCGAPASWNRGRVSSRMGKPRRRARRVD